MDQQNVFIGKDINKGCQQLVKSKDPSHQGLYFTRKLHYDLIRESKQKDLRRVGESQSIYTKTSSEIDNYKSMTGERSAAQKLAIMDKIMQKIREEKALMPDNLLIKTRGNFREY